MIVLLELFELLEILEWLELLELSELFELLELFELWELFGGSFFASLAVNDWQLVKKPPSAYRQVCKCWQANIRSISETFINILPGRSLTHK